MRVEQAFYVFLNRCYIYSKDTGYTCLGERLYDGQRRFITLVFDCLERDIHKIFVLKSRQLGLSTIARAMTIFLLGIFDGLKGAVVFDTDQNKVETRAELEVMIKALPKTLKFPGIKGNNRSGLTLKNDSKVLFMSAGTKKTKGSGVLGRSVGLAFAHLSELCSYDNEEGLEAFDNSLSDTNPDRLYIYESTARGFNRWYHMWLDAKKDPHCGCLFLGWWSKPSQVIMRDDADFLRYGVPPVSEKEADQIATVKRQYGHDVTIEQLAWVRRKMDPTAEKEGDAEPEFTGSTLRVQEQPWTEEEAFQQTGAAFFAPEKLTQQTNMHVSTKYQSYMYLTGDEFVDTEILRAPNSKMVQLKVWEPPVTTGGIYVISCDPAHGENEDNDRASIQVCRCYADGLDQVAEYASTLVTTQHLAYVLASLLGWYGQGTNQVRYVLELQGGGDSVFRTLKTLRYQLENGRQPREYKDGMYDIFRNVRTFIWTRADSMAPGHNYHLKTTVANKVSFMETLRNYVQNGMLHIRSLDLIAEFNSIARQGDKIEAPDGMKDDRAMAMAFAVHCWDEKERRNLITQARTRLGERRRQNMAIADQVALFQQNQLTMFFNRQQQARMIAQRQATYQSWRGGGLTVQPQQRFGGRR
ncbi:MAG TPA: hypothetical protein VLJ17_24515 [Xanthobacteraceae bacterium]|nr:hypothetical protein [Xanthobacteraceae bacterium]